MALCARDVMQHNVGIVDASATLAELEAAFVEAGVSGFPVVEGGRVVGVVSLSDVVQQLGGNAEAPRLSTFYADLGDYERQLGESLAEIGARGDERDKDLCTSDVMTRSVITVAPDAPLAEVARTLLEHTVHRVLVTDGGTLVGVVSSLDLVRMIAEARLGEG